ncbi:unnamed protein product [Calypogeia fissa]
MCRRRVVVLTGWINGLDQRSWRRIADRRGRAEEGGCDEEKKQETGSDPERGYGGGGDHHQDQLDPEGKLRRRKKMQRRRGDGLNSELLIIWNEEEGRPIEPRQTVPDTTQEAYLATVFLVFLELSQFPPHATRYAVHD